MSAKDLTKEAPRSPRERLGGYAILARAIDKCAADIAGTVGDYHTNCPLDRYLFDWKGTDYAAFRALVQGGVSDGEIVQFINETGTPKSAEEIAAWSDQLEAANPYEAPDKRDWFVGVCEPLGLDPKTTTLFTFLETDDEKTFS
ncbi:MAG TPA: DUF5069 domain-containing protein [Chthoniobacterales bacterium]|nr:DUF5069 domain-containing protein [Chthoniobacterales bacterium]